MSNKIFNLGADTQQYMNLNPYKFNEFSKICYHLAQQKNSRIAGLFLQTTYSGRATTVQSIDSGTVKERKSLVKDDLQDGKIVVNPNKPDPQTETPNEDFERQRRWIFSQLYEWGKLYDKPEEIQAIIDPHSVDMQALKYAFARQYDKTAFTSLGADVQAGEYQGTIHIPFDANQVLPIQTFNVEKALIPIWEMYGANEVDMDEPQNAVTVICNQKMLSQLMSDNKYQNFDYNNQKVLTTGRPDTFMGVSFVHYEGVDKAEGKITSYGFAKSGMMFAEQNGSRITRMAERPDRRFNVQVYECRSGGAVRLEEKKVVKLEISSGGATKSK